MPDQDCPSSPTRAATVSPLITVGLITYNRMDMLREAVHSVLNQTHSGFHLIIGNDCPDIPVTLENLGCLGETRVTILNREKNLGEIANMNDLLQRAESPWFTWLADDDLFHPECFRELLRVIDEGGEGISAAYSNYTSSAAPTNIFHLPLQNRRAQLCQSRRFIRAYAARKYPLVGCFGLMKTEVLKRAGGILQLGNSFSPYCDTLLPILMAEHGDICWVDLPLVFLRTHKLSRSVSSSDFEGYTTAETDFIRELRRVCGSTRINMSPEECVKHMIFWFIYNEWGVLLRNPRLNRFSVVRIFVLYQFRVNFPRLAPKYWLPCLIYTLRVMHRRSIFHVRSWCIKFMRKISGVVSILKTSRS